MTAGVAQAKHAARSLRRSPGVAIASIVTLALGIALATIVFSIVYGVFIKGLPFHDPGQIVVVQGTNEITGASQLPINARDFRDYRDSQHSLSAIAAYVAQPVNVVVNGHAERFDAAATTGNTFSILGVRPMLGRDFSAADDQPGAPRVAMLSYATWQERFAANPSIVGTAIRINGETYTVAGVMPQGFRFPQNNALWLNLPLSFDVATPAGDAPLAIWGRLRPGVGIAAARANISAIAQRLRATKPRTNEHIGVTVNGWIDGELGPLRQFMYTMLGAAVCVLLIGCANVANLLLERAIWKTKETGVRLALGATRLDVARIFIAESWLLASAAVVIGLPLAWSGVGWFNRAIADTNPPFYVDVALNAPVFAFAALIALGASVLSALLPARQATRVNINEVLKDDSRGSSSRRSSRMSRLLVTGGIALSCGLLVAAGLMSKSITRLSNVAFGFSAANVLTADVELAASDPIEQRRLAISLEQRLRADAGVDAVSLSSSLPGVATGAAPVAAEGASYARARDYPMARVDTVTPGFFQTFEIHSVVGRSFTDVDRTGTVPVAVISQNLAARLFRGSALGRRVRLVGSDSVAEWKTIVGVVPATYSGDARNPFRETLYISLLQAPVARPVVAVRSPMAPVLVTKLLRDEITKTSMDAALFDTETMDAAIARPMWKIRLFGRMFIAFGALALFLGAVGLYAMMAASVARRSRELGVRMALGAQPREIVTMILRQGAAQIAVGMVLGLVLALGVGRFLSLVLFDVQPGDPAVLAAVVSVLALTGLAACVVPAWRATRVDPLRSFRA